MTVLAVEQVVVCLTADLLKVVDVAVKLIAQQGSRLTLIANFDHGIMGPRPPGFTPSAAATNVDGSAAGADFRRRCGSGGGAG